MSLCNCPTCRAMRELGTEPLLTDLGWFKGADVEFDFVEDPITDSGMPVMAAICHPAQEVFGITYIWREA